jgi:hypothetical protein
MIYGRRIHGTIDSRTILSEGAHGRVLPCEREECRRMTEKLIRRDFCLTLDHHPFRGPKTNCIRHPPSHSVIGCPVST